MKLFGADMVALVDSIEIVYFKIDVASNPLLPAMLIFISNAS